MYYYFIISSGKHTLSTLQELTIILLYKKIKSEISDRNILKKTEIII